jgi:hypothetical protein
MRSALDDQLQVAVALCRRGLPWRLAPRSNVAAHDRRIGITLADRTVDIVPIVRSIAG